MRRKTLKKHTRGLLVGLMGSLGIAHTVNALDLSISIEGLRDQRGQILLAVYSRQAAESFPGKAENAVCALTAPISRLEVTQLLCADLDPGEYAAVAVHDVNANGVLDHNFIGMPKEPIKFSSNCKIGFGPPKFASCKFEIEQDQQLLTLVFQ